ncbi:MAG TPA: DNA methyltransferase [Sedimentisphaerales bacterium]|nr:DNA methyltransferase [Sedimentisphaerales bacterium]
MPTLVTDLRNKLERVVVEARDAAEAGARAALEALAVHEAKYYPHMSKQQQALRNHLRAHARQLGDRQDRQGRLQINRIIHECAFEHWHRMLFARFLAENNLLIEPQENIAISLDEAEELAKESGEDVWTFASRCAQKMLPQIFRPDDPLLAISFATEHKLKLERLLGSLQPAVFTASDALGWVYQFWQSKKKDEVNRSEVKIGADELPAVTQLFTEPYMVSFLIHNTLGAWWAGKKIAENPNITKDAKNENALRAAVAMPGVDWDYLRFVQHEDGTWRPAAGTFGGWPKTAAEIKVLDPCCGSGHFLVAVLHHLIAIRMTEENISAQQAVDAVLRDNLYGLEIDERCCQIAAFALAFAAWTYPDAGGYRPLLEIHIACTGIGPQASEEQWLKLAEQSGISTPAVGREAIKNGLLNLHRLFSQAPTLGSLIDPVELPADLIAADYETVKPYLDVTMSTETSDDEMHERVVAAAGMVKAVELLAGDYTLVITNVPYLGRGKQEDVLKDYCSQFHPDAKADLATCFVERCLGFPSEGGTAALVTTQYWLFLTSYKRLRKHLLKTNLWNVVARLGPGAFETISGEVVNVALLLLTLGLPGLRHEFAGLDVSEEQSPNDKKAALQEVPFVDINQQAQLNNPNSKVVLQNLLSGEPLEDFAIVSEGLHTGDYPRFGRNFWELLRVNNGWAFQQGGVTTDSFCSGMEHILFWERGEGVLIDFVKERLGTEIVTQWIKGDQVWGKCGIAVGMMGDMKPSVYQGMLFTHGICAIVPKNEADAPAIRAFCESYDFCSEVRKLDQKVCAARDSVAKVPFDISHWQKVAAEKYPNGLPKPESDSPTQWLFHGWAGESNSPLHVAVARLLGYRWPAELDDKMQLSKRARDLVKQCDELLKHADDDGIVCIQSVRGEEPATDRLMALLNACGITSGKVRELTVGAGLDDWLRNNFFEEHCKLFHNRPFVWHIWDGRKRDGFHALVNYHKLAEGNGKGRKLLESLTYSYLGDWISRQEDGVKRGEGGAEDRLAAALELKKRLEAILAGEPPYDIFVRWKPLHQQSIGWEPDINDGVRMNIRPFLASDIPGGKKGAGILRWKPNIKWGKDRGKEPKRPKEEYPWFWGFDTDNPDHAKDFVGTGKEPDGNRWNDCHYTNKTKQAAREAAKGVKRG